MKNMVKKNQVMITALALMIAVAGYLNFAGNRITQEEIVTTGSDTVETAKVTGDDSQYEDIQSMDSELVLEEDNYLEQSMDDILAEDITVDEENADLEAGSDSVEEITGDVPGEAVFTSVAGMDSLSGAKLLKEQTRAKSKETFLEIINNTNIAEEQIRQGFCSGYERRCGGNRIQIQRASGRTQLISNGKTVIIERLDPSCHIAGKG